MAARNCTKREHADDDPLARRVHEGTRMLTELENSEKLDGGW